MNKKKIYISCGVLLIFCLSLYFICLNDSKSGAPPISNGGINESLNQPNINTVGGESNEEVSEPSKVESSGSSTSNQVTTAKEEPGRQSVIPPDKDISNSKLGGV